MFLKKIDLGQFFFSFFFPSLFFAIAHILFFYLRSLFPFPHLKRAAVEGFLWISGELFVVWIYISFSFFFWMGHGSRSSFLFDKARSQVRTVVAVVLFRWSIPPSAKKKKTKTERGMRREDEKNKKEGSLSFPFLLPSILRYYSPCLLSFCSGKKRKEKIYL